MNTVTKEYIDSRIKSVQFFNLGGALSCVSYSNHLEGEPSGCAGSTTTVCVIELDNGYTVTGYSACVDPANFDLGLGVKYSREDAYEKLWPLLGFELATKRAGL